MKISPNKLGNNGHYYSQRAKALLKFIFVYGFRIKLFFQTKITSIPILFYHQVCDEGLVIRNQRSCVSPQKFNEQMHFLYKNGYTTVNLDDIIDWLKRKRKLPKKSVCITFDDGHRDNNFNAYPILQQYGMKATIFICTDQIGKEMWYSRKNKKWERAYDDQDDLYFEFLNWDQIHEMNNNGIVFQPHTCSHPFLTRLREQEVIHEVAVSKEVLENELGKSAYFFSYPYGNYNKNVKRVVASCGFHGACTAAKGHVIQGDDSYLLKRIWVDPTGDIWHFQMQLSGIDDTYYSLGKVFRKLFPL